MMRKIELAPYQQKQMEAVLKRGIRECNEGMKLCKAEGNESGIEYIREVKRKPLIKKLMNVQRGFIME